MKRNAMLMTLLALSAGCSHHSSVAAEPPSPERATTVRVENNGLIDMNVFVLSNGQRYRLGMVPGAQTQVFTVPPTFMHGSTQLRFEMDPIGGGGRSRTETTTVLPGDQVRLMITP